MKRQGGTQTNPGLSSWWRGKRGEWYLAVQVALFVLLAVGPRTLPGLPLWRPPCTWLAGLVGIGLMLTGGGLALAGLLALGPNLTPLPLPKADALLVASGPYRLVRHPIYSGLLAMAWGWGLWLHAWLTLGYAVLLLLCLDRKARREERWLRERFPAYAAYQQRTRRLIPFVY